MRENGNSFEVQQAYEFVFALHLYPLLHTKVRCNQFGWTQRKPTDIKYNGDTSWFDSFHCNSVKIIKSMHLVYVHQEEHKVCFS